MKVTYHQPNTGLPYYRAEGEEPVAPDRVERVLHAARRCL